MNIGKTLKIRYTVLYTLYYGWLMIVLSLQDIHKSFGIDSILNGVQFALQNGEHMGLTGVNGSGKTTMLRIICGEMQADSGLVHIAKDSRIGYLAQNNDINDDSTVMAVMLEVFKDVIQLEQKISKLEQDMAHAKDDTTAIQLANSYHHLTEQFNKMEGYAYQGEIIGVLNGLGFTENHFERLVGSFSGGEKTRLSLARILLQKPDILLMDEPTNHLDLDAIAWLEEYLNNYKGALIVISHDRYFLDHVCNSMGELINGKIIKYTGNYSDYQKKRAITFEAEMKAYNLQQKQIAREKNIIAQYRQFNREKSIRAAESRQKRLDKLELLERPAEEAQIDFHFEAKLRSGEEVLKVRDVAKGFDGKQLFKNISFDLRAGDRVALIGKNGVGKSTLLKIIMHQLQADEGYSSFGVNVDPGYFDQHHSSLQKDLSVLDNVWNSFPKMQQHEVRGALGLFLFTGDEVFKPTHMLSGGERARVLLTKLMLQKNNFLLLDEPTNHLDADSREVLEQALADYSGTILAISHDRYFINKFANKIFLMDEESIEVYLGNYDDFVEKKNAPKIPLEEQGITRTELQKQRKKTKEEKARIASLEKELQALEKAILDSEQRCTDIETKLANPDTYKDGTLVASLQQEYATEQTKQQNLFTQMEEIDMQLQKLQ